MEVSFNQLFLKLKAANRLMLAFAVVAFAILVYLGSLASQYWPTIEQNKEIEAKISQLNRVLNATSNQGEDVEEEVIAQRALRDGRVERFVYGHEDELITMVSEVARSSRVTLNSLVSRSIGEVTIGPFTYESRVLQAAVEGRPTSIYGFIENLSETAPSFTFDGLTISGFSGTTSSTLNLKFFINPVAGGG